MKIEKNKDRERAGAQTPFPPGLAKAALRALANAGYTHLEQLATVPEKSLMRLHGLGPNAIRSLREGLKSLGKIICGARSDAMNQLQQAAIELRLDDLTIMIRCDSDLHGTLLAASSAHDPDPTVQVVVIRYLLQHGVAVNETDKSGVTPLHRAVRFRSLAAVKELIAHGAAIDAVDNRTRSTPPSSGRDEHRSARDFGQDGLRD